MVDDLLVSSCANMSMNFFQCPLPPMKGTVVDISVSLFQRSVVVAFATLGLCLYVIRSYACRFPYVTRRMPKGMTGTIKSCDRTLPGSIKQAPIHVVSGDRFLDSNAGIESLLTSLLCCGLRKEEYALPSDNGPRKADPSSGETRFLHPKFCGARLSPGHAQLPSLLRMVGPWRTTCPREEWERCMETCSESERRCCEALRDRVDKQSGPKDAATMLRFVRARRGDIHAASRMYVKAMHWRESTGLEAPLRAGLTIPGPFSAELELHRRIDPYWPPCGLLGQDFDGDPVYWNRVGNSQVRELLRLPTEFFLRHESYTSTLLMLAMEELARQQGRQLAQLTVVVDLADLGLQHTHPAWARLMQRCVRVAEDYYPELVKRIILVRAPGIFPAIFRTASRFFDEGTKKKINIVGARNTFETLAEIMDKRWIPEALGGTNSMELDSWCAPCIPRGGAPPEDVIDDIIAHFEKARVGCTHG
eukprot:TRINITY_DN22468_c0_g1_i1.p1 TRINITY_DN22468_c0_g1~~TRINITY_DN22468_c0_g1_i1.p1  ORF type:complete len:491 (-),score=57.69 TRINITY_DN22468_c0_g1_i1:101-1528(-)